MARPDRRGVAAGGASAAVSRWLDDSILAWRTTYTLLLMVVPRSGSGHCIVAGDLAGNVLYQRLLPNPPPRVRFGGSPPTERSAHEMSLLRLWLRRSDDRDMISASSLRQSGSNPGLKVDLDCCRLLA